jgi:hypothetical protein
VDSRSDLRRIERRKNPTNGPQAPAAGAPKTPATEQLLDLCEIVTQLSATNGKRLNASMFVGLAVKEGCHPDAIIETLAAVVRKWKELDKPIGYWHTTLADRNKAHGAFDWSAHPVEKQVWSSIAAAAKAGGSR